MENGTKNSTYLTGLFGGQSDPDQHPVQPPYNQQLPGWWQKGKGMLFLPTRVSKCLRSLHEFFTGNLLQAEPRARPGGQKRGPRTCSQKGHHAGELRGAWRKQRSRTGQAEAGSAACGRRTELRTETRARGSPAGQCRESLREKRQLPAVTARGLRNRSLGSRKELVEGLQVSLSPESTSTRCRQQESIIHWPSGQT